MPSRFLTLWSLLSKQGSSTQLAQQQTGNGSSKKKANSKKDADASLQVRYRSGPIIPVYGEQSPVMNPKRDEVVLRHKRSDEESGSHHHHHHHHRSTSSVFRRSHFFRKSSSSSSSSSGLTKNHQSVDSLAIQRDSESRAVSKSQSVGGLSQRSLRVCQAKRVAPPIVPESVSSSAASLNQQPYTQHEHQPASNQHHHNQQHQQHQHQQQQNRHSGSSFDSSSAESTSGGYCSGSGSLSSCHAPSSSAWSQAGSDQRSSLGLDDAFLPPPPASPAAHSAASSSSSKHHMYSREGEPLYGSRGSPGYGSAGIFTYPSPTGNSSNGIYGTVGGYRTSQASFVMDHSAQMVSNGSAAVASATASAASAGVGSATLVPHPATYAHQISLDDQGIDLTQSPGRESPSSSSSTASVGLKSNNSAGSGPCRHSTTSTTSLDSGRASGTFHQHAPVIGGGGGGGHVVVHHQTVRYSAQAGYETCLRNSYHSSSSSLGSSGGCSAKIDDIHRLNVCEMLSQGVPEHEILNAWLTDLGFEEYYDLFVQAGYDMHTITRMTPEDLTAIGIQKPNHRKKLKAEIALLHIPDGLPDFIPDTLEEWLSLLGLAEYSPSLRRQGYRTVEDVTQLTWEDLEDFGILRLGHQKKITLAIKRVKDILSGKYVPAQPPVPPHESHCSPGEMRDLPLSTFQHRTSTTSCSSAAAASSHYAIPPSVMRPVFPPVQQQQQQQHHHHHHHHHHQQQHYHHYQQQHTVYYHQYHQTQPTYKPDVVAIQVHRNRSSEDVRAAGAHQPAAEQQPVTAAQQTFYKPGWRQRSYEDGDANPAGELSQHHLQHGHQNVPGGGTLPRPRGTVKPRPVAKISAKTRTDCCPDAPSDDQQQQLKASALNLTGVAQYGTLGKKNPPPAPPKRANSGTSLVDGVAVADSGVESIYGTRGASKSSPLPLPPPPPITSAEPMNLLAFSDDSDDFPPPPAPITASDSYMQHGQHASSAAASVRERLDNILQRTGAGHWPGRNLVQPPPPPPSSSSSSSSHYGVPNVASRTNSAVSGLKMVQRECSPSDSNEASDTEPGSPAMEFRQRRNGSDASFKSTSSTESDSMPFANDNAGTIKQRNARTHPALAALTYSSTMSPSMGRRMPVPAAASTNLGGASDVLNDIGNMLADLTDELDSMLEEENSGNNQQQQQPIRQKS